MLGSPVADQRLGDGFVGGFDPRILELGQLLWIALPGEHGIEDGEAALSGDVADDMMQIWSSAFCKCRT